MKIFNYFTVSEYYFRKSLACFYMLESIKNLLFCVTGSENLELYYSVTILTHKTFFFSLKRAK